ncbi:hypothetical protein V6N11_012327 [Hibiscus sabdariffa]|uniref:Uncharacterized protein n=1 Tax=Hibiscus sabdariffa TaxID=183260 RepID=A0ABR2QB47_9ROSI
MTDSTQRGGQNFLADDLRREMTSWAGKLEKKWALSGCNVDLTRSGNYGPDRHSGCSVDLHGSGNYESDKWVQRQPFRIRQLRV